MSQIEYVNIYNLDEAEELDFDRVVPASDYDELWDAYTEGQDKLTQLNDMLNHFLGESK